MAGGSILLQMTVVGGMRDVSLSQLHNSNDLALLNSNIVF